MLGGEHRNQSRRCADGWGITARLHACCSTSIKAAGTYKNASSAHLPADGSDGGGGGCHVCGTAHGRERASKAQMR